MKAMFYTFPNTHHGDTFFFLSPFSRFFVQDCVGSSGQTSCFWQSMHLTAVLWMQTSPADAQGKQQESKMIWLFSDSRRVRTQDTMVSPTWSRSAGGWKLLLFSSDSVALPWQTDLLGDIPDTVDSRPCLHAGRHGGEGQAAGWGVHEDVAQQQAVEATEHVHHTVKQNRTEEVRELGQKEQVSTVRGSGF